MNTGSKFSTLGGSDNGKGTKITMSFDTPRIIQVRASVIFGTTLKSYFNYERKKDDPHRFDSAGAPNNLYTQGKPDYVGIASEQGYEIRQAAKSHLGSTYWAQSNVVTIASGFTAGKNFNKCNIFAYEVASPIKTIPVHPTDLYPPRAFDWQSSTPEFPITGWGLYYGLAKAEPGVIIARPAESNWLNPFRNYGHCGITDYDGAWINAGRNHVNRYPHITDGGYQPASFRK